MLINIEKILENKTKNVGRMVGKYGPDHTAGFVHHYTDISVFGPRKSTYTVGMLGRKIGHFHSFKSQGLVLLKVLPKST